MQEAKEMKKLKNLTWVGEKMHNLWAQFMSVIARKQYLDKIRLFNLDK